MKCIKKYWWILIIMLVLPVGINYILLKTTPFSIPIVGEDTDWLSFWGGYLGAIISTGAAFIILYIQRKDNERQNAYNRSQNKSNRQLQLNILQYQQEYQWYKELKVSCIDYYNAFDQNDIINLCNLINEKKSVSLSEASKLLESLIDKNNKVTFQLEFQFSKNKDEEEIRLLKKLEGYNLVYMALIYDAQYIIRQFKKNDEVYSLYDRIDEYKKRNTIPQITTNRIVTILEQSVYYSQTEILNKLFAARKNFSPQLIKETLSELIKYEEEKINKIIEI